MPDKLIFLSHIHEESNLAVVVKTALEKEFSGFVDVFVSSDGISIPAGANFLKRIEDGLISCIGAIYLISPISVKRNWINFELGAVWIRNIISLRESGPEIPTLPMCHSGITPSQLPSPLNNLNGIAAGQASQLEFAFRSLQKAVGGKGDLRTDFDDLATQVRAFELQYTVGASLKTLLSKLSCDMTNLIVHCESLALGDMTTLQFGFVETDLVQLAKKFESAELAGHISVAVSKPGISSGPFGAINGAHLAITLPVKLVLQFKDQIVA